MNAKWKLMSFFLSLLLFTSCSDPLQLSKSKNTLLENLGLLIFRTNKANVSGTAVKGIVKNAEVIANPLRENGECDTNTILGQAQTDEFGKYSISFQKTGGLVCVSVKPSSTGNTKMYDEKISADISLSANSEFSLVNIVPESKIKNDRKFTLSVSPFSKLLSGRLQELAKQSPGTDLATLHKKASKEIVIRFGLKNGLSTKGNNFPKTIDTKNISDEDFPELEDLQIDWQDPNNPISAKAISILVGISELANKTKSGQSPTPEDIQNVVQAFADDFADGAFDGKGSNGKSITIGSGANSITFPSTPLSSVLLPAIVNYFREGGTLSVGVISSPPPVISSTLVESQTQFIDNAPIISTGDISIPSSAPIINYPNPAMVFLRNVPIATIFPTVTGSIVSCAVSATLPAGLVFDTSNCSISGNPTTLQASTPYTVTATNTFGSTTTNITITINDAPPSALSYPGTPFLFTKDQPITPVNPIVTGTPTSYSVTTLPDGLSIHPTTGQLSGTPTVLAGTANYTVTATNSVGSTTANITIKVGTNYVVDFDGVNDRITTTTMIPYNGTAFTVSAWVKTSSGGTVFAWGSPVASNYTTLEVYFGKIRSSIGSSNLNLAYHDGISSVNTGTWVHIAVVKRTDNTIELYRNGISDYSGTVNASTITTSPTDTSIGAGFFNNSYQGFFTGRIDELTVWNVAKTSAEIANLVTTPPIGNEAGLVAYYKFENGAGTALTNLATSTGATYNGTLYDFALTGTTSNWVQDLFQ